MNRALWLASLATMCTSAAGATFPSDFETAPSQVSRLYSYFGGVSSFAVALSNETVFSGQSQQLTINFLPSSFATNGVGVGSLGIAAPSLSQNPANNTFSVTIKGPAGGTLAMYVTIREDDNASGTIDIVNGDDEWESPEMILLAGIHTYNIPYTSFALSGEGSGNLVRNFNNTPRMAFLVNFETRANLPGGLITTPTVLHFDHLGFFPGPQTPPPSCVADINDDSMVSGADLSVLLAQFGQSVTPGSGGDINDDGMVSGADLSVLLAEFGIGC